MAVVKLRGKNLPALVNDVCEQHNTTQLYCVQGPFCRMAVDL
jgi:hypothetical protein